MQPPLFPDPAAAASALTDLHQGIVPPPVLAPPSSAAVVARAAGSSVGHVRVKRGGVATRIGVEWMARSATTSGHALGFVADAMTTVRVDTVAAPRVSLAIGRVGVAVEVAAKLTAGVVL